MATWKWEGGFYRSGTARALLDLSKDLSLASGRAVCIPSGEHVNRNEKGQGRKIEHLGHLQKLGNEGYAHHHPEHIDQNEPDPFNLLAVV